LPADAPAAELAAELAGPDVSVVRRQLPPRRRPAKLREASSPEYEDELAPVLRASKLPRVELASTGFLAFDPAMPSHELGPFADNEALLGGGFRGEVRDPTCSTFCPGPMRKHNTTGVGQYLNTKHQRAGLITTLCNPGLNQGVEMALMSIVLCGMHT
jgi:hypothetical protein